MIIDYHSLELPSLLSLIPPFYMVVPNRELANKSFLNSSIYAILPSTNTNVPAMDPLKSTGIDIFKEQNPDNYDDVRGRTNSHSPNSSRDASMVSSTSSIPYHEKMEKNNGMEIDNNDNTSQELFYETLQEKEIRLGKVTGNNSNTRTPHGNLNINIPVQCVPENNPTSPPPQGSTV